MGNSSLTDTTITQNLKEMLYLYLDEGWYLFPVLKKDKIPLTPHGFKDGTNNHQKLDEFIGEYPECNWGGYFENQLIIDIDPDHNGSLEALETIVGKLPKTRIHKTGSGGFHIIFKQPNGYDIRNTVKMIGLAGIDRRGNGGYIVLPPSIHKTGNSYEIIDYSPIMEAPKSLLVEFSENSPDHIRFLLPPILEGVRNNTLTKDAGLLRAQGFSQNEIEKSLLDYNKMQCKPPLPEDEVRKIAWSVCRYPPKDNKNNTNSHIPDANNSNTETKAVKIDYHLTDLGNAQRLIDRYGLNLRYCYEKNQWLSWNGKYWEWVNTGSIIALASETILNLYHEIAENSGNDHRELLSHAKQSEGEQRLKAMVALAQTIEGIPIKVNELDSDQFLFNCNNGTLNLKTGELLEHDRNHFITKFCPVNYDPKAIAPMWDKFLIKIMANNQDLINYLQKAIGYSLTGSTKEQVLFFLYGGGCNGKSTFANIIRILVADYGIQASTEIFLVADRNNHNMGESLARLQGVRIAIATETEEGRRLSVAQVKAMTGGEPITAAPKYQHEQQFEATHKIWISGNHKPKITDTTYSIWRRMKLIPFVVTIPENERDADLLQKLQVELTGILTWAIKGCLDWQKVGLLEPNEVKNATQGYRDEEDSLREFIIDKCTLEPKAKVEKSTLWIAYLAWCTANREQEMGKREFGNRLIEKGIISKKGTAGVRIWEGIKLLDQVESASKRD
jgi:putative DNA primase/helicase